MRFLADECLPQKTVLLLRKSGFKVVTAKESDLLGADDKIIFNTAVSHKLILITVDQDFSNIISYPPQTHNGIIVLKLTKSNEIQVNELLVKFLKSIDYSSVKGNLIIIDKNKVRIRR